MWCLGSGGVGTKEVLQKVLNRGAALAEVPAGGEVPQRSSVTVQGWDG